MNLSNEIKSKETRAEKVELINAYIEQHGYSLELVTSLADAKYFSAAAVKQLIISQPAAVAVQVMKELKDADFNLTSDDFESIISTGDVDKLECFLKHFSIKLTKANVISIANQFPFITALLALDKSQLLDDKIFNVIVETSLTNSATYEDYLKIYTSIDASSYADQAKLILKTHIERSLRPQLEKLMLKDSAENYREALNLYTFVKSKVAELYIAVKMNEHALFKTIEKKQLTIEELDQILEFSQQSNVPISSVNLAKLLQKSKVLDLNRIKFEKTFELSDLKELFKIDGIDKREKVRSLLSYTIKMNEAIELARKYDLIPDLASELVNKDVRRGHLNTGLCSFIKGTGGEPSWVISEKYLMSRDVNHIYENLPAGAEGLHILKKLLELPSELTKVLRTSLTEEHKALLESNDVKVREVKSGNKRTWFNECLDAITAGHAAQFSDFITDSYPLSKLVSDSKVESNKKRVERVRSIPVATWINLSIEEIEALKKCGLSFADQYYKEESKLSIRKWPDSEIKQLPQEDMKFVVARLTKDNEAFVAWLSKNKFDLNGYDNNFEEVVKSNCKIDKYARKSFNKHKNEINDLFDQLKEQVRISGLDKDLIEIIAAKRKRKDVLELLKIGGSSQDVSFELVLNLECKEGRVFVFDDSTEVPKLFLKYFGSSSYGYKNNLNSLVEAGYPKMAKAIAEAYCSKEFKKALTELGLNPPTQRREFEEIASAFLNWKEDEPETKEVKVTLRGIKGLFREPDADTIAELRQNYTNDKIIASLSKAFGIKGNEIVVPSETINYSNATDTEALVSLLKDLDLTIVIDFSDAGYWSKDNSAPLFPTHGRIVTINKRLSAELYLENTRSVKLEHHSSGISHFIYQNGPKGVDLLSQIELVGEEAGDFYSLDPEIIIEKFGASAAVYILGQRRLLNLDRFLAIQENESFDKMSNEIISYAASILQIDSKELPILVGKRKRRDDETEELSLGRILNEQETIELVVRRRIEKYSQGQPRIEISGLSPKGKVEAIKYAAEKWGIELKFNVAQANLNSIDYLDFSVIQSFEMMDGPDLAKVLHFNPADKKLMQNVKDRIAVNGPSFVHDALSMQNLWNLLDVKSSDFNLRDFIGSEDEDAFCVEYSAEIQDFIENFSKGKYNLALELMRLSKLSSGKVRDWLKSSGRGQVEDTLNSIQKLIVTYESAQSNTAESVGVTRSEWKNIKANTESAYNSLLGVIKNSDFGLIHDVVIKLASSTEADMYTSEKQDKYEYLEAEDISKTLNWQMYFPKLFADTYKLGIDNGWCTYSLDHGYSDKVRSGDAVLIGIAPIGLYRNKDETINACEALLYIVFDKRDEVLSHQIQMSKFMSKDLKGKLDQSSGRQAVLGRQTIPDEGRYPVGKIIDLVIRARRAAREQLDMPTPKRRKIA